MAGLNNAAMRSVGVISYSLYLYHIGVQFALFKLFKRVDLEAYVPGFHARGFVYSLLFLPAVLALSAAMYFLVERPCLRLIARWRPRPAQAPPGVSP